jgi:hypothetical protein
MVLAVNGGPRTPRTPWAALALLATFAAACNHPSQPALPFAAESANYRYYYGSGDHVDSDWQERYHAWATAQLGILLPQKISYYKYVSRQDMGDRTGRYNTNAFALPETFEIHTLWPTDNHEVVHVYTSLFGRPSSFFNEGMAVAFQVDPVTGDFVSRFNGVAVHDACRQYLQSGTLVLPLDRIIQGSDLGTVSDSVLAYREAGSFVRFTLDQYGLPKMMQFFRTSPSTESAASLKAHFQSALGIPLDQVEQEWLAMLRTVS